MQGEPVYITGFGASTPIGRDMWSSAAAVRAGISGFTQHPYMIDTAGEPMKAAIVPWLDIYIQGIERFEALLYPAIDQVLTLITEQHSKQLRLGLAVGLPSPRPGLPTELQANLSKAISRKYPDIFAGIACFPNGHAAGFVAMEAALKKMNQGEFDVCIVAGVDSYIEPETLEWLEECDQLHGAGPLNNAWGFIPGEAAGAVLLIKENLLQRLQQAPFAWLLGLGVAFESKLIKTETVCIGDGLTKAFRSALETLPDGAKVTGVYCDMNGEPYRADEFGFAMSRVIEMFEVPPNMVTAADCTGDVGAASGPLHIALATISVWKRYAKVKFAIVHASSENGDRGAVLMSFS